MIRVNIYLRNIHRIDDVKMVRNIRQCSQSKFDVWLNCFQTLKASSLIEKIDLQKLKNKIYLAIIVTTQKSSKLYPKQ